MIKIEAKDDGKGVNISIKVSGQGKCIVSEVVAILVELPRQIADVSPELFEITGKYFEKKIEELENEETKEADDAHIN